MKAIRFINRNTNTSSDILHPGSCKQVGCNSDCYTKALAHWDTMTDEEKQGIELIERHYDPNDCDDETLFNMMQDMMDDDTSMKHWDIVLGYREKLIKQVDTLLKESISMLNVMHDYEKYGQENMSCWEKLKELI